jgi:hypothetical protein
VGCLSSLACRGTSGPPKCAAFIARHGCLRTGSIAPAIIPQPPIPKTGKFRSRKSSWPVSSQKNIRQFRLYEELPINFSAHYSSRPPLVIAQAPNCPIRHEQSVGHSLLKMPDHRSLGSRYRNRQHVTLARPKLDDEGAISLRTKDHDPVLAVRCYRRFFLPHSSWASRFTADAWARVVRLPRRLGCHLAGCSLDALPKPSSCPFHPWQAADE